VPIQVESINPFISEAVGLRRFGINMFAYIFVTIFYAIHIIFLFAVYYFCAGLFFVIARYVETI